MSSRKTATRQSEVLCELLDTIRGPKQPLLYQGERYSLHTTTSSALGPNWLTYPAEWIKDRLDGKPMESKNLLLDSMGETHPFEIPRR
jgi:hypothetical protein